MQAIYQLYYLVLCALSGIYIKQVLTIFLSLLEPLPFTQGRSPHKQLSASAPLGAVRMARSLDPSRFDMAAERDPVWAREVLLNGWQTAFPLNALTDEAVAVASNYLSPTPPDFKPFLAQESHMTTVHLRQAYS